MCFIYVAEDTVGNWNTVVRNWLLTRRNSQVGVIGSSSNGIPYFLRDINPVPVWNTLLYDMINKWCSSAQYKHKFIMYKILKGPRICSVCRNAVLPSFMNFHRISNMNSTTAITISVGTACHSGLPVFSVVLSPLMYELLTLPDYLYLVWWYHH